MTQANEPDIGPLTWVKGEIDQALSHAAESLQAAAGAEDASAKVQFAQNHLHQANGALSIIGLDGLTKFVAALDLFLGALSKGELPVDGTQIKLGRRALASVGNYLEEMVHGAPNQPLRLLPLYRELVLARGEADPSPADLFFPDSGVRLPPRDESRKFDAEQRRQQRRTMRLRFQRGLIDWLRRPEPASVDAMRTALAGLETSEDNPGMRALWWAGQAFVDTLPDTPSDELLTTKHLLSRIESQLRRAGDGPQALPERLLREMLYYIAVRPAKTPAQKDARQTWQLGVLIPEEGAVVSDLPLGPLLKDLYSQLTRIKDEWNTFGEQGATALPEFGALVNTLTKSTVPLGRPVLFRLLGGMSRFIAWLGANPQRYSEPIALEFATALLLAESALARGLPDPGFQSQVGDALSRLEALARGEELAAPPSAASVESARKQQEKEALAQLSHEILSSLATIEQTLDDFFRDHSKRAPLETLQAPLHQIEGALSLLGEGEAISLVQEAGEIIARLAQPDSPVVDSDLTELARRFSALGFFIQSLQYNRTPVEHFLNPAAAKPEVVRVQPEHDTPVVPSSAEPALEGIETFPTFEIETEEERPAGLQTVAPTRTRIPPAPQADLDAELLTIFIEEAHEVLESVDRHLQLLPSKSDNLTDIRRGFHTLKGSGRMVGLTDLGEAAWGMEQTLNRWLQLEWPVTPTLVKLIAHAHREFLAWVDQIENRSEYRRDVAPLLAEAERLRSEPESAAKQAEPALKPVEPAIEPEPVATQAPEELTFALEGIDLDIVPLDEQEVRPEHVVTLTPRTTEPDEAAHRKTDLTASRTTRSAIPKFEPFDFSPFEFDATTPDEPEKIESGGFTLEDFNSEKTLPDAGQEYSWNFGQETLPPETETSVKSDILHIDNIEISRALFELYVAEAQMHISTLHQEFDHLAENPTLLLPEASLRAAHSCAGISGTAHCAPLHHLGKALELAQQRIYDQKRPPTSNELALFKTCTNTLESMLTIVTSLHMPLETPELIEQVDRIGHAPGPVTRPTDDKAITEAVARTFPEAAAVPAQKPAPTASVPPVVFDEIDEQLLPIFLEEAEELINGLHATLRSWSNDTTNPEHAKLVRRQLHTFKGSARMAGAMNLGSKVHQLESRVESVLSAEGDIEALVDEIASAMDGIEQMVAVLGGAAPATTSTIPAPDAPVLVDTQPISVTTIGTDVTVAPLPQKKPLTDAPTHHVAVPSEGEAVTALRVRAERIDGFVNDASEIGVTRTRIEGELRQLRQSLLDLTENVIRLRNQLREVELQADVQIQTRIAQAESTQAEFDPLEMDRYTRLQELTRMMAESVNDVTTVQQNLLKNLDSADLALHSQARITRELQQALMQVRMVPFESLATRLYRIVRRGAKDLNKRANLDIRGGGIEIDRSVLDHIIAPLEHLLRNSLAHGIEPPSERRMLGKSEIGQITLTARQEGNEIVIELADDGAGLNFARIAARARERGLLGANEAADERWLANLIFTPGFSTAEKVTAVSGRGVGMDVVKAETAAVGGRIDISTTPGAGTLFSIYLPLTLAVTQALLVRAGTQLYAIPASMISQIMELKVADIERLRTEGSLEWMEQQYAYHYLPKLLGNASAHPEIGRYSWVLLLHSGSQTLALHVDALRGHQEIIVKNAGPQLTRIAGMSGATVLGNGEIVLIINPVAMVSREMIYGHARVEPKQEIEVTHEPTVMVVDDSLTVRKITSRMLEREGYRVITAKDGVDAIESLIDNLPDVILSDIEMPRMDGFDLVRNIRADARLRNVPVIMITSRLADKHRDYAMEIGANHYLGKPYQEEELLGIIAGYMQRA